MSRVETKVWAAVVGAGGGTVVGNAVLWFLGVVVWNTPGDAAHSKQALEAVPPYIASLLALAFTVIGAFAGGYVAPPSNNAGNALGGIMDDLDAGHALSVTAADPAAADPGPDVQGLELDDETPALGGFGDDSGTKPPLHLAGV